MRHIITSIIGAVALTSCELFLPTDITDYADYSNPNFKQQIVLQGYISPDYGVMAEVSSTMKTTARPVCPPAPEGTEVLLLQDGQPVATLHRREAITDSSMLCQKFDFFLMPNEVSLSATAKYALQVKAPGLGTATSEAMAIPTPLVLDSASVDAQSETWAYYHSPADNKPFVLYMQSYYEGHLYADYLLNPRYLFSSKLAGANALTYYDRLFVAHGDSVVVQLVAIPDAAQDYIHSLTTYEESSDELYSNYPEPVLSNIDGGIGFVTTMSASNAVAVEMEAPWFSNYFKDYFDLEENYGWFWWGD